MKNETEREPALIETITVSQDTILRPYAVGIDTHKKFIQVCILKRTNKEIQSAEFEFSTLRAGLASAKEPWAGCLPSRWDGDELSGSIY